MDEDSVPATPKRKATPLFFDSDDEEEGHIAPRTVSPRSQLATKRVRLQDETLVESRASEDGRLIGDLGDIMADGASEEAATDERVHHEPASLDTGAPLARMVYGGESGHVPLVPPQVQHSLPTVESVTTYKKRSPTKLNLQTRPMLSPLAFWDQSHSKRPTSSSFSVLHKSILASRLQRPTPVEPTPAQPPAEPAVPTPWHTSIRQTNEKSLALKRPKPAVLRMHEPIAQRPTHDNNSVASSSSEHRPTPPISPSPSIISISDEPEVISIHSTPSSSPSPMVQDEPEPTPSEEHYMINADNRIVVLKSDGRNYYPNALVAEYDEINEYHLVERHDDMSKHWRAKLGLYLAREGLKRKRKVHSPPWMLAKFPRGYNLYVHVKGLQRDKFNARKDYYLYGSDNVFRSPEEFAFHLIWLARGMPTTRDGRRRCGCKYCSHRSQTEITAQLRKHLPPPPPVLANSRGYNTHHQPAEQRVRSPELTFKDYTYLAHS